MLNILIKNKKIILTVILFFSGFYLFFQNIINNEAVMGLKPIPTQVCIKENCFDVEIADTAKEREIGLMNREHLAKNSGMLFVFEKEDIYNFWMKNTLIPLDIIWIDGNNKIIFIKENAEPCKIEQCETFEPKQKAKYVLEINGGLADELGIEIGDEIEL